MNGALLDPAWRWHTAESYADTEQAPPRTEEPGVRRATRYIARLNNDDGPRTQHALERMYPDLHWAYRIWMEETGPRWYIEALILSGLDSKGISEYLGQDEKVINTFEKTFFDVRKRLENPGYILSQVISKAAERGIYEREYDFLWKLLGLTLGPAGLKNYWGSGKLNDEVIEGLRTLLRDKMLKDSVAAAHVRKVNQYSANEIISQYVEMIRDEADQEEGKRQSETVAGLAAVLGAMNFEVMPINAPTDGAVEPREDATFREELLKLENKDGQQAVQ